MEVCWNVFASREVRATAGSPRSMRRSTSSAHSSVSFRRRNVSLTYCPFRRTWAREDPESSLVNVAKRVRFVCTEPSNCRVRGAANGVDPTYRMRIHEKCFQINGLHSAWRR